MARLLTPADFGLVAMVNALVGFAHVFAEGGLSVATVQSREIGQRQVSALFWVNVVLGIVLTLAIAAAAPALSWFYGDERLVDVTLVSATTFLFVGLGVQHDALLRRQMRFRAISSRNVTSAAVALVVALTMAWKGAGYWALVVSPLVGLATRTILSWLIVRWRPGRPRRGADVRPLLELGGNLTAANCVGYLSRILDQILIGRYWGAGPLGLYSKAYNLLVLPFRQLDAPLATVALPALSRVQDEPERQARYFLRTANLLMWITLPLVGYLFVCSDSVIVVVLGDQWRESAAVFRIFAVATPALPLFRLSTLLLQSRGRTDRLLKLVLLRSPIIAGSAFVGLPFGINGVALALAVAMLATMPWVLSYTFAGTRLTLPHVGRAVLYPLLVWLVTVGVTPLVLQLTAVRGDFPRLTVAALSFVAIHLLAALAPPVGRELRSLRELLRELRLPRRSR